MATEFIGSHDSTKFPWDDWEMSRVHYPVGVETVSGKVALVTGGSRGIGRAIARTLLARGMTVIICGTKEPPLVEAVNALRAATGRSADVHHVVVDVRDYGAVERMMQTAVSRTAGLDVLVNNAGVGVFQDVEDTTLEDWHAVLDTNLTGVFHCCRAAIPHLRRRGGGWIINISSLAGKNPFGGAAAYCASKAGLNAFSEALMQEVRHDGIRVAYVLPGSVNTEFRGQASAEADWKLAPEDVAQVVADLIAFPSRSLPSRVELRPSRPPQKA
jgi:NAD(P)-dependent dehydrogenase (short-subunit alcohol dehydrogenase family)